MRERVRSIVKELLNFKPNTDPATNLRQFIQEDQNFLCASRFNKPSRKNF